MKYFLLILSIVGAFLIGWSIREKESKTEYITKTIVKVDTINKYHLMPLYTYHTEDTIFARDTIYIKEVKTYQDSAFKAVVSGYNVRLDSIQIYRPTIEVIKEIKTKKRLNIGIQGGYGITPKGLQPYIGIGIVYNFVYKTNKN